MCHAGPFTNRGYYTFVPLLDKHHIKYVDGHVITQQATQIEKTPLFPQGGTHWNYLGAYYTTRAMIDKLNGLLNRKAGRLELDALNVDHTPTGTDKDLAELLNLFFPPIEYVVPHPIISKKDGTEDLGRVVIVGGSFNWIPIDLLNEHKVFEQIDFFYYYTMALHSFPGQRGLPVDVAKIDWENSIFKSDVIILEINEANITGATTCQGQGCGGDDFVSDALQHLRNFSPKS